MVHFNKPNWSLVYLLKGSTKQISLSDGSAVSVCSGRARLPPNKDGTAVQSFHGFLPMK